MGHLSEWVHALPLRVATKFALTFTAGALLAIGLVVTGLALHERRAVEQAAAVDLQSQGNAIAPILAEVWAREGEAPAAEMLRVADAANGDVSLKIQRSSSEVAPPERDASSDRAVAMVPIQTAAFAPGHMLVLEKPVPPWSSAITEAVRAFLLAAIPLAFFAMLSAYALGEWLIGAPLRRVADGTRRIGGGDLDHPLVVRGSDEIRALKRAINRMSEDLRAAQTKAREEERRRIDAVHRLRQADRLTTVGTLAAGIAHELGTPLNVILLESRATERNPADAARIEQALEVIRNQAGRMIVIVRQMLDFARRKSPTKTSEDAVQLVSSTAVLVSSLARVRGCTIELEGPERQIPVLVDASGIQQILTNLFVNAFDAMPQGGRVLVRVTRVNRAAPGRDDERSWGCIEVEDDGIGMDEATSTRVFEPFFTTKDVGSGTGLGLSVALGIAEDHGGFMDVRTKALGGSVFAVYLPITEELDHESEEDGADALMARERVRLSASA